MFLSPLSLFFALTPSSKLASSCIRSISSSSSSLKMNNIIVVGSANVDLNSYSSSLPKQGETILGHEFKTSLGGKGANQCIQAAKLNQSSRQIHMVCKVGQDDFGKELINNFQKTNVRYSSSDVYSDKHTGIATINVDSDGENTIVVCPGSNHDLTASDVEKQVLVCSL